MKKPILRLFCVFPDHQFSHGYEEKEVVVKPHIGGDKTLVALLMAQSVMNETREPVLYLAPTNQLVEQVLAKSHDFGIAALRYIKGQPLPAISITAGPCLVGAYETLIKGRGKFGVRGSGQEVMPDRAIILDDALLPCRVQAYGGLPIALIR